MKIEIIERGTDVVLVSRDGDGFIVPRKNETVTTHGDRYVVREVNHYYRYDDLIEVLVEAE